MFQSGYYIITVTINAKNIYDGLVNFITLFWMLSMNIVISNCPEYDAFGNVLKSDFVRLVKEYVIMYFSVHAEFRLKRFVI